MANRIGVTSKIIQKFKNYIKSQFIAITLNKNMKFIQNKNKKLYKQKQTS